VPQWNSISVSGYHMREAGSTAVQELAFTLADGLTYLGAAKQRGLDPTRIAKRMSFFFNAHNHLFEEVAKFRAARKLWAELLEERFGITDPEARKLRFHTQTAGSMLTAQQPLNNVVRVTVQALSAILGGTQSLHTNSFDEALGLPSSDAALLALRSQQVLAHESGVTDAVDPLAGSYFVESLTAELETRTRGLIDTIDRQGGMLAAIASGWVQQQIHLAAYQWQRDVESGDRVVVGVNRHSDAHPIPPPEFAHDPGLEGARVTLLRQWRASRAIAPYDAAMAKLVAAARGSDNLVPRILDALVAQATLGEVCDALRGVFGTYRPGDAA
jgi:methylmalonyl-CoA mutase N-terminal domain/subunit